MRARAWAAILLGLLCGLPGCSNSTFRCANDAACDDEGTPGVCTALGYCGFDSQACASGFAYGDNAPAGIAGECVDPSDLPSGGSTTATSNDPTTSSSGPPETSAASSSSTGETITSDTGVGPCPEGSPCLPADPCATAGACQAGACVPIEFEQCLTPPGDCFAAEGTCNAMGVCEYTPLAAGTACSDADACTVNDSCDGSGTCVAGEVCPSNDPCMASSCSEGACESAPVADGTSCGVAASARCCGGSCVDITNNTAHCGGCNTGCAAGQACEPIDVTSNCTLAAPETSGRCRCQMSNAQCPLGQLCRTVTPHTNRCVPANDSNCHGTVVLQSGCPSYCEYQ